MSVRSLGRARGYAATYVLTLGLALGAVTSVFSAVEAVLLRVLPYGDPEQLVAVWNGTAADQTRRPLSGPDISDLNEEASLFEGFAAAWSSPTALVGGDQPVALQLGWVSPNFFGLMRAPVTLGRDFEAGDGDVFGPSTSAPGPQTATGSVILSHGLWQRAFGADAAVPGQVVYISGRPMTVIGVAQEGFQLRVAPDAPFDPQIDAWTTVPANEFKNEDRRAAQWLTVIGRLLPGTTLGQGQEQLQIIAARQRERHPRHAELAMTLQMVPLQSDVTGDVRSTLIATFAAVVLLLLIAVANLSNLGLVRSAGKAQEMSVRVALGASRRHILRITLTEHLLLAGAGGFLGVVLALWGTDLAAGPLAYGLPQSDGISLNRSVIYMAVTTTLLAGVVAGLLPAMRLYRGAIEPRLRAGRSTGPMRVQEGLAITQVAFSVTLLVAAGLVLRSAAALNAVDPGFRSEGVLTAEVALPFSAAYADPSLDGNLRNPDPRVMAFEEIARVLDEIPSMRTVGAVGTSPLSGDGGPELMPMALSEDPSEWSKRRAGYAPVLPGYFEAASIPLLRGRLLDAQDNRIDAAPVIVIDAVLAARLWPGRDPIGNRILAAPGRVGARHWREVVGVVESVRYADLATDGPGVIYVPLRAHSVYSMTMVMRTGTPLGVATDLVGRAVQGVDVELPAPTVLELAGALKQAKKPLQDVMVLLVAFGLTAVALATVGLGGVMAYLVRSRGQEMGIRLALGATPPRIRMEVLRRTSALAGMGVVVGVVGALYTGQLLEGILFGVSRFDPMVLAAVSTLSFLVCLIAGGTPAWRASSVEMTRILRSE